jgi:hypothetical protein
MHSGSGILVAAGLLLLTACGGARSAGETEGETAPAPAASAEETKALCAAFDRVIAARLDAEAFSSLPENFELKPGVPCGMAELDIAPRRQGPAIATPVRGYACLYLDKPGEIEANAWPVWTGVLEDVAACFGGLWEIAAVTDARPDAPTRRVLMSSQPDVPLVTVGDGSVDPVRFEWSQDSGQGIVFFVAAP